MEWRAFWSSLLGAATPSFVVALVMLVLTHQTNRRLENYKKELDRRFQMLSLWHSKRVSALLDLYEAFRRHLNFLRRILYPAGTAGGDVSEMHDLPEAVDKNLVYLDDDLAVRIRELQGELLVFWNWAARERERGDEGLDAVRHRLDFEIPGYLDKLRELIGASAVGSGSQGSEAG